MTLSRLCFLTLGLLVSLIPSTAWSVGPEPQLLWPDGAPGQQGTDDSDKPSIRVYRPDPSIATPAAVVICPGGGYGILATDHEGHQVAEWFRSQGVTGVVLRYRHAPKYRHPAPLQDVSRALRHVRAHAGEWNISPDRVGVMGFSAGGHLASTASTHFDSGQPDADDPIERQSSRPDFSILCYPVISFTADYAHQGSARNLLGENPDPELLKSLSNETQVTPETPPTFLFHTQEDVGVPVQNALAYYAACAANGVPAELHVYQNGPHGVGLSIGDPVVGTWKERLLDWLQTNGFLADGARSAVQGSVSVGGQPLAWGTISFIPKEVSRGPVAAAIVANGRYSIPANRGPLPGAQSVVIKTMGAVKADPTIENSAVLSEGILTVDVVEGDNQFEFRLE
ncbi:MAG: alpha/beta hydrolase [Planctomyces sp.]|nr:alpha/beta hydrolase [Planctomyces sp.]